ncbi:hypothetical protein ACNKU7_08750 [Microbulbifer sp. SA54]|uniref:hypothetical protein n=1 Tax=Microbulbifer sp. SA54 TaxID=3401577 RepID=UPI003AAE1D8D
MSQEKLRRTPYQSKVRWLYSWVHPTPEGWVTTDWYKKWLDFSSLSILIAILTCGITGWFDFGFSWSLKGINKSVFEVLKLPVGIATAELAVLALMVSNYRAAQQQRQITASESHNNFTNYFKHRDYLEEKLNGLKRDQHSHPHSILKSFDIDRIHLNAFPGAKTGDLSCLDFFSDACALYNKAHRIIENVNIKQESFPDAKKTANELLQLSLEVRDQIILEINGFGFKHGLTFSNPNRFSVPENYPKESTELFHIQTFLHMVAEIISKIISCGFTDESLSQQEAIQNLGKKMAWNMSRYLELAPMKN